MLGGLKSADFAILNQLSKTLKCGLLYAMNSVSLTSKLEIDGNLFNITDDVFGCFQD